MKRIVTHYGIRGFSTPWYEMPWFKNNPSASELDLQGGGFNEDDAKVLTQLVGMVAKQNMVVVDIGCRKGNSTATLAKAVADYHGAVYGVDHWQGSEGLRGHEWGKEIDIFSIFRRNMGILGILGTVVHPMVMDSETAARVFADGMLDLVFIDGDHRYEGVKKDILSWLPKLRIGGILCGHDCEGLFSEYSEEDKDRVNKHLDLDNIDTVGDYVPKGNYVRRICHPGVVKGVHDLLTGAYYLMPNSTIWYHRKPS